MDNLDFVAIANGLEVSFRVLTKVPAKAIFDWDFGDDKGSVMMLNNLLILMKVRILYSSVEHNELRRT